MPSTGLACDKCGCCRVTLDAEAVPEMRQPTILDDLSWATSIPHADVWTQRSGWPNQRVRASALRRSSLPSSAIRKDCNFCKKLTTDMNVHNPAVVVYPGDLVDTGSVAAWNQWKNLSAALCRRAHHATAGPGQSRFAGRRRPAMAADIQLAAEQPDRSAASRASTKWITSSTTKTRGSSR